MEGGHGVQGHNAQYGLQITLQSIITTNQYLSIAESLIVQPEPL